MQRHERLSWFLLLLLGPFLILPLVSALHTQPFEADANVHIAALAAGMGIFGFSITWTGLRQGQRSAWIALWYWPIFFVALFAALRQPLPYLVFALLSAVALFAWLGRFRPGSPAHTASSASTQRGAPLTNLPPTEDILYEANWTDGLHGWVGGPDWNVANGLLVGDGHSCSGEDITAPLQTAAVSDFAIEADVRVTHVNDAAFGCKCFGIAGRCSENGGQLSDIFVNILLAGCDEQPDQRVAKLALVIKGRYVPLVTTLFDPGFDWHTYRLELKGSEIHLFLDGDVLAIAKDHRIRSGEHIRMWSHGVQIRVRSLKVVTL